MVKINNIIQCIGATVALLSASGTHAIVIDTYTDYASWQAAAGSHQVETFTGETAGGFTSRDFGDFTVTKQNGNMSPSIVSNTGISGEGLQIKTFQCGGACTMDFAFDYSIFALAFDWRNTDSSGDRIQIAVVDQTFVFGHAASGSWPNTTPSSGFFGIVADTGFGGPGSIRFSDDPWGGGNLQHGYLDNIRYASSEPIPEPTTLALMGLGLAGIGCRRRRLAA